MKAAKIPYLLNIAFFILALFLSFASKVDSKTWDWFPDTKDYLNQSKISVYSSEFYFTHSHPGFYPRPFTVPLFYKLTGSNPKRIVWMQKFMHCLATFILVYSLLLMFKTRVARYISILPIYFLMSWWNIFGWTTQVLSESLILSFLFLWIGTFLIFFIKRKPWFLAIHIFTTILFSFTRDSWPYVLIFFYLIILIIAWIWDKPIVKSTLIMLFLSIAVYFIQGKSSEIGQRTELPVINNILVRILSNHKQFDWFVIKGMPMGGILKQRFTNNSWKVYGLYVDPEYKPFRGWAAEKGKGLYTRFLLTHPRYTLLLDESPDNIKRIYSVNVGYVTPLNGYSIYAEKRFPFFSTFSLVVCVFLLLLVFIWKRKVEIILPIAFTLLFIFNTFLLYNADSMEVARHLFITMILIQFLCIWMVSLLIDRTIQDLYLIEGKTIIRIGGA